MKRFTIALLLTSALFLVCALAFNDITADMPTTPPDDTQMDTDDSIAGRYHLRGRTKRFFGRVS